MKKTWKKYEQFVVFKEGEASLLCEVTAQKEGVSGEVILDGMVINGAWSFTVNTVTGNALMHYGQDNRRLGWVVVPLSDIPGVPKGDYNDVLGYIRDSGFQPGQRPSLKILAYSVWGRLRGYTHRLKKACTAFWVVLTGQGKLEEIPLQDPYDESDEIPF